MRIYIFIFFLCYSAIYGFAQSKKPTKSKQYTLSGVVTNVYKTPLSQAQIILSLKDSLCGAVLTDEKGQFIIGNLAEREYLLQILHPGFTAIEQPCYIRNNTTTEFTLTAERNEKLEELVVEADRSQDVTRTATGQIFYLSEKAKNSGDPYLALNEIPRLRANSSLETITMTNGNTPLILVDGNRVNTGVNPIDPKEIESVEIVDVISAKYLRLGVKNIINIKLKKKENPYTFVQGSAQYAFHRNYWGSLISEVGTPNYSFYIRMGFSGIFKDKLRILQQQQDDGYQKIKDGITNNTANSYSPQLLFKWRIAEKDYFAVSAEVRGNLAETEETGNGSYQTNQIQDFAFNSAGHTNNQILSGRLYHKHSFTPDKILETTLSYNKNGNQSKNEQNEIYPDRFSENFYEYDNRRSSALLNVDYSWKWNKVNNLNIGNETKYLNDRIHQISENYPIFHHREWNEYLYAGFSRKAGNLLYMVSAGLEGIWLKAGDAYSCYLKPRIAASGTWRFSDSHSIRLGYTLTNTPPSVGELNPYNTSVDPLVISRGNPELLPVQQHELKLNYTLNIGELYIEPEISYHIYTDMIEPFGYTENGIYISTYKNTGFFKRLSLGGTVDYELNDWVSLSATAYHYIDYFAGQEPKKSFYCDGNLQLSYQKWILTAGIEYRNYEHTALSRTRQLSPDYSYILLRYDFTKNFNISAAVAWFTKTPDLETIIQSGTYTAHRTQQMVNPFNPWIRISYTLRKNTKSKIKLDRVMESSETGITLK